jgi:hypothetical protein
MPDKHLHDSSELNRIVERQMRRWELTRDQAVEVRETKATKTVQDFVCISRQIGVGGGEVARLLADRLDWPLFDREILAVMAGDDRVRAELYASLDERDVSWLEDTLRWILEGEFRSQDYFHRLVETILALAWQGRAVFLGRGCDLILPRERGLRVRLIALKEWRVHNYARVHNVSQAAALAEVERVDRDRTDFIRRYFRRDIDDPSRQDLIINVERFAPAETVELIVAALRVRGIVA